VFPRTAGNGAGPPEPGAGVSLLDTLPDESVGMASPPRLAPDGAPATDTVLTSNVLEGPASGSLVVAAADLGRRMG